MANGQETGIETLRAVIARQARGHDWSLVRDFHQGQRSATALKGRIHDRTPTRLPKRQKALAERGPSIHDGGGDMTPRVTKTFTALTLLALACHPAWPQAQVLPQDYPNRTVTIVAPAAPGG